MYSYASIVNGPSISGTRQPGGGPGDELKSGPKRFWRRTGGSATHPCYNLSDTVLSHWTGVRIHVPVREDLWV